MKTLNNTVAVVIWVVFAVAVLSVSSPSGLLFFAPFAFSPHFVTHMGIVFAKQTAAQAILLLAQLGYCVWFLFSSRSFMFISTLRALSRWFSSASLPPRFWRSLGAAPWSLRWWEGIAYKELKAMR